MNFDLFPLQKADCKSNIHLGEYEKMALGSVQDKIKNNIYMTIPSICLCGEKDSDIVITKKDRLGFSFDFKLCKKCSLVRTDPVLDNESLMEFYKSDFASLHRGGQVTDEYFFRMLLQGKSFLKILDSLLILDDIDNVLEVGCSSGGNLYGFHKAGKEVLGYDYDEKFLDYGKQLGMNLNLGDYYINVDNESQDLVIVSHVLEHFLYPVKETIKIIEKIKCNKYLLVEVPGVLSIANSLHCPTKYFKSDHIYHFHKDYLSVFFKALGLEIVYSDEICRFVLKKPVGWKPKDVGNIYSEELGGKYKQIEKYIKNTYLINRYFPYKKIKSIVGSFLRKKSILSEGFKEIRKKAVILNDTSIEPHHGCHEVMNNIKMLLKRSDIDVIDVCFCHENWELDKKIVKSMQQSDVVIVNGEGTLHDDQETGFWLAKAAEYCKSIGVPSILMNSTYYNNGKRFVDYVKCFDLIFVRQSLAQKELKALGINSEVVPDMTFYTASYEFGNRLKRKIGFTDSVFVELTKKLFDHSKKSYNYEFLPILTSCNIEKWSNVGSIIRKVKYEVKKAFVFFNRSILKKEIPLEYEKRFYYIDNFEQYIKEIYNCKLLVTGRFHSLCFSIQAKTPFLVMNLGLNKVEGMLADIGIGNSRIIEIDKLDEDLISKFSEFEPYEIEKIDAYLKEAVKKIETMFVQIKKLAYSRHSNK